MKNRDVAAVCSGPEQMRDPAWRFVNSVEPANDRSIMRNCTGGGLSVLTAAERISSLEKLQLRQIAPKRITAVDNVMTAA
jgi:hypothetical protein